MKDVSIRTVVDDGKFSFENPNEKTSVTLVRKEDWHEIKLPGEYAWSTWAEAFETLVLVCPFCGFEAPMPWLIRTTCKDPLDIAQELYCKNCSTHFQIIHGVAYKSWIPISYLKKILEAA